MVSPRNVRVASRPRTPRRRKVWIGRNTSVDVSTPTSPHIIANLLSQGMSDLGVNYMSGVTVMRIFGNLYLDQRGDDSTPTHDDIKLGIAWLRGDVASAGAGDAQIPEPMLNSYRETDWIQQWNIGGISQTSGNYVARAPLQPVEQSMLRVDVTQMRKQPQIDSQLCLVGDSAGLWDAGTVFLTIQLQIMCALP